MTKKNMDTGGPGTDLELSPRIVDDDLEPE
jgi:hypothetical protein